MRRTETKLRLLRDHEFFVHVPTDIGEDFVLRFRETWDCLPATDQQQIVEFWRQEEFLLVIALLDDWPPESVDGQVGMQGYEVKFRAESFRHFPKKAARWVIAHELAHVIQWATNRCRDPDQISSGENEQDADRIAEGWGFARTYYWSIGNQQHTLGVTLEEACEYFDGFRDFDE